MGHRNTYLHIRRTERCFFLFFLLLLTRKGVSFPLRKKTNICKARFCFSIYYYIYFNSSYRNQYSFIQRASLFHICEITKKVIYLSARHWPSYMTQCIISNLMYLLHIIYELFFSNNNMLTHTLTPIGSHSYNNIRFHASLAFSSLHYPSSISDQKSHNGRHGHWHRL